MALVGYARVSTNEQETSLQIDALKDAGCVKIFEEKLSGAKKDRPELAKAIDYMRRGDTLIIWKLDRLGRSLSHLVNIVEDLDNKGMGFKCLTNEAIDTTSPSGKLVFHIFAGLAEFERELIRERTIAGLEAARARGRVGGRPKKLTDKKLKAANALIKDGMTVTEAAKQVGVARRTLYYALETAEK